MAVTRALRPKPVEVVSDEPWIWGNNRGGGGAPLKLADGTPVANLRDVMKGNVQPDHSPTRSPVKAARNFRDEIDDDNRYDGRYNNRNGGKFNNRDNSYHDDYDSRDERRLRSPPTIRGLEDHYDKQGRRRQASDDDDYRASGGSGTHVFVDPEKALKAKRDLDYQNALKAQIEEKKRAKEEEKRKMEEIKFKEYEEYCIAMGRKPPPRPSFDAPSNSGNNDMNRSKGWRGNEDDERGRGGPRRDNSERDAVSPIDARRRRGGDRGGGGGGRGDDDDYYRTAPPRRDGGSQDFELQEPPRAPRGPRQGRGADADGAGAAPPRNGRRYRDTSQSVDDSDGGYEGRSGPRGGGAGRSSYVTQEEYDDLASKYDVLQREHEELREEIRLQAQLIEGLKLDARSREVTDKLNKVAAAAKKDKDGIAVKKNVAFGGPVKPHAARGPSGGGIEGTKQPKADRRPNSMSTIERKRTSAGAPGLKLPKLDIDKEKVRAKGGAVNAKPFAPEPPKRQSAGGVGGRGSDVDRGGGGGGGMMGLLARKGGPITVAYDAEDDIGGRASQSPLRKPASLGELRGQSEHLEIRGEEVDVISEHQLGRLLQQARNARAGGELSPPRTKRR